jgi:hypothetical protein
LPLACAHCPLDEVARAVCGHKAPPAEFERAYVLDATQPIMPNVQ